MSVAAVETPVPAGDAPAPGGDAAPETETEETEEAPAEGEQPADGATEGAENPDIEPAPDLPKAAAELDEETLRSAAFKFANKTMAAVRRAEKRVETVKTENTTLKGHLQTYAGFVERLQKGDATALREIGFPDIKSWLDAVSNFGETKPPTADDRVTKLERELAERNEAAAKAAHEAQVAESQRLVFAHIDLDKARWRYTATAIGREQLWDALGEYFQMHGEIPDAAVPVVADAVEKHLRAQLGDTKDSGQRQPAKNGASPAKPAAVAGRNSGKTLTSRGSVGAPVQKKYSADPDERRKQIEEELRAEGLLDPTRG